jgi:dGTPase
MSHVPQAPIQTGALAHLAARPEKSRGRLRPEEPCFVRTDFQRDRDRIVHAKAFRRLMHKTQVFLSPEGDHYRTRLTHALEVSQIARVVARALGLNEDLTEAIALGHDIGHTPFGHIGESAFTECLENVAADFPGVRIPFRHNEQSLRVVDVIERKGRGLNLTEEVRDGILNHTGPTDPFTLEGRIVKIVDRIAYVNHDIDDAIRGGVLTPDRLPREPIRVLGETHGERLDTLVRDMILTSAEKGDIALSDECLAALTELRSFLFDAVYLNAEAKAEDVKAKKILIMLFYHYFDHPEDMPEEFQPATRDELPVRVCDYVAGMTDRYALKKFEEIYVPQSWMV